MARPRIIPVLLLRDSGLVKTVKFKTHKYVGDPINAVKIFNDKEVDELILLDITASIKKRRPHFGYLKKIAEECFMPLCYGGGISSKSDIKEIIQSGIEKVSINSAAIENPEFIKAASEDYGSSTIVVAMDVKRNVFGKYTIFTRSGSKNTHIDPVEHAVRMQEYGAGELLINSIDRDGTYEGYDLTLIKSITSSVDIPIISCGGASGFDDLVSVINDGQASAAAAGSLFVFHGKHRAVLINYPPYDQIKYYI